MPIDRPPVVKVLTVASWKHPSWNLKVDACFSVCRGPLYTDTRRFSPNRLGFYERKERRGSDSSRGFHATKHATSRETRAAVNRGSYNPAARKHSLSRLFDVGCKLNGNGRGRGRWKICRLATDPLPIDSPHFLFRGTEFLPRWFMRPRVSLVCCCCCCFSLPFSLRSDRETGGCL